MIPNQEQRQNNEAILLLSEREKIALDAYLFNPANKIEAYKVAKGITDNDTDLNLLNIRAGKWLNNKGAKAYVANYKAVINAGVQTQNAQSADNEHLTKAQLVEMLERIIVATNTDHAKKAEYILKLADLQGFKKETTEKEEKNIRFYIPISCANCAFLKGKGYL